MDYIPEHIIAAVHARVLERHGQLQCEVCAITSIKLELSHTIAKGMGGRHNEAELRINSAENIQLLCHVCHQALYHHTRVTDIGTGHSCTTCWKRARCPAGISMQGGATHESNPSDAFRGSDGSTHSSDQLSRRSGYNARSSVRGPSTHFDL